MIDYSLDNSWEEDIKTCQSGIQVEAWSTSFGVFGLGGEETEELAEDFLQVQNLCAAKFAVAANLM